MFQASPSRAGQVELIEIKNVLLKRFRSSPYLVFQSSVASRHCISFFLIKETTSFLLSLTNFTSHCAIEQSVIQSTAETMKIPFTSLLLVYAGEFFPHQNFITVESIDSLYWSIITQCSSFLDRLGLSLELDVAWLRSGFLSILDI